MFTEKMQSKPLFRVDVKDYRTKKIKGFNVYDDDSKMRHQDFLDKLRKKVEEISRMEEVR